MRTFKRSTGSNPEPFWGEEQLNQSAGYIFNIVSETIDPRYAKNILHKAVYKIWILVDIKAGGGHTRKIAVSHKLYFKN